MRLILTDARPTQTFYRGEEAFLVPDLASGEPDKTKDIVIENVSGFRSEHFGFLVHFKDNMQAARACHDKTAWPQDGSWPPREITLFAKYDFGQRCFYINDLAYMSYCLEE